MLRCAEAEGTELTGGPGWQRRGEGQRAAESGRWLVGSGAQWERRRGRERAAERSARAEALAVGWAGALRGWSGPGERERCAGWAGESRLGRARKGTEGVGRGFGWARKLGFGVWFFF